MNHQEIRDFSSDYLNLLTGEFAGINLTRIQDSEDFFQKQILDSLKPLEISKNFQKDLDKSGIHLDIGFGGGFPILPVAKFNPKLRSLGFEARRKKAEVVGKIASRLNISNVDLYHMRVEDTLLDLPCVVTFKAVGTISDFLKKINASKPVTVYFYKGPKLHELENWDDIKDSWEEVSYEEYDIEGTEGRSLIAFKNKNVPRGTRSKKKNLFKLSELL